MSQKDWITVEHQAKEIDRLRAVNAELVAVIGEYHAQHDRLLWDGSRPCACGICLRALAAAEATASPEPDRPRRVCLCGSTRFGEAYRDAMREETLAGKIVLTVGLLGHQEGLDMAGPVKVALDQLHLRKIDLADEVLILNVGGYVGESTRREIAYAEKHGKLIRWLIPIAQPSRGTAAEPTASVSEDASSAP